MLDGIPVIFPGRIQLQNSNSDGRSLFAYYKAFYVLNLDTIKRPGNTVSPAC